MLPQALFNNPAFKREVLLAYFGVSLPDGRLYNEWFRADEFSASLEQEDTKSELDAIIYRAWDQPNGESDMNALLKALGLDTGKKQSGPNRNTASATTDMNHCTRAPAKDGGFGWTASMVLAGSGGKVAKAGLRRLLKRGVDISARDSEGWTALHWAILHGQKECVADIADRAAEDGRLGALCSIKTNDGQTCAGPAMLAIQPVLATRDSYSSIVRFKSLLRARELAQKEGMKEIDALLLKKIKVASGNEQASSRPSGDGEGGARKRK